VNFTRRILWVLGLLILGYLCLWPFAVLLGKLLTYTSGGGTSVFSLAFNSASTLKAIMNTVVVGILVAVLSCIISLPLAWIFARTDLAGRHIY